MRTCLNCDKSINECPYKEFNIDSDTPCIYEKDKSESTSVSVPVNEEDDDDLEYLFLDNKGPKIKPFSTIQRIIAIILTILFFGGLITGIIYSFTSPKFKKNEISEVTEPVSIEEPVYVYEIPTDLEPVISVPEPQIQNTECKHTKTFTKTIDNAYHVSISDDGQCYNICSLIEIYCSECGELLSSEETITDTIHNIRIVSNEVTKEYIHTKDTLQNEETTLIFGCSCGEIASNEVLTFDTKDNPEAPFYNTTPGVYTYITKIAEHNIELVNYEITPTEYTVHLKCAECDYTEDEVYPLIFEETDHEHDHNEEEEGE